MSDKSTDKRTPRIEGYSPTLEDLDMLEQRTKSSLSERDRNVTEDRFGLRYGNTLTYKEIGLKHNISLERVRQIVMKTVRRVQYQNKQEVPTLVIKLQGQGIKDFHIILSTFFHGSVCGDNEILSIDQLDLLVKLLKESKVEIKHD